ASLGQTLANQDFPEDRMDRLLTASGTPLPGLIDEALHWLESHRVNAADLSVLTTLGIADALGDNEARQWARKQIALDFVDAQERNKKHSQGSRETLEVS